MSALSRTLYLAMYDLGGDAQVYGDPQTHFDDGADALAEMHKEGLEGLHLIELHIPDGTAKDVTAAACKRIASWNSQRGSFWQGYDEVMAGVAA